MQTELIGCDLENTDAIALLEKCQKEEVSISEKNTKYNPKFFTQR